MTPTLIALYVAIAWIALALPAAVALGRGAHIADHAAGHCHCGTCPR